MKTQDVLIDELSLYPCHKPFDHRKGHDFPIKSIVVSGYYAIYIHAKDRHEEHAV